MKDISKELWFIERVFYRIHINYSGKTLYTTGSIRERYGIRSWMKLLPRLEKVGPDLAYLYFRPGYIPPKTKNEKDYIIVYELYMNKIFNLPVDRYEPEGHLFLVIRDNSQIIEIKLFKYINEKPVLVKDYC